jgi:hypothetical protein
MLWIKAFHVIFMVAWFAGLCLFVQTLHILCKPGVAWREASSHPLPLRFACARTSLCV